MFVGKGYTFDASEMNEQQKAASMQKRQYEIDNGMTADDELGDVDSDEDDLIVSNQNQAMDATQTSSITASSGDSSSSSFAPSILPILGTAATVATAPAIGSQFSAAMTPVERARALVESMAMNKGLVGVGGQMATKPVVIPDSADPVTRALMMAKQFAGTTDAGTPTEFSDEFEINDYPAQVSDVRSLIRMIW